MKRLFNGKIKKISKKTIISLSLAMMFSSSMPFLGMSTPATVYATSTNAVEYSGQTETGGVYYISSAEQLKQLANSVNAGNSYEGTTFIQTADIDLGNFNWIPIGGQGALDSAGMPVAGTKYFAGVYNGMNYTISNLKINKTTGISSSNNSCYGLFGYSTGALGNIKISGSGVDNEFDFGGNSVYAVGGVVGFTTGSVINCRNNSVDIIMTGTDGSNMGGIIGVAQDAGKKINLIKLLNESNVRGRGRVGGVIGATYTKITGNVIIDEAASKGTVRATGSRKAWSGGVVGYNMGEIYRSYFIGNLSSDGAHYISGVAGILNGYGSAISKMNNCYSYATFLDDCNPSYDRPLFGSADRNPGVNINNSIWSTGSAGYTQPSDNTWGTQTNVTQKTKDELRTAPEVLSTLNGLGDLQNNVYFREVGPVIEELENEGLPYLSFEKKEATNDVETIGPNNIGQIPGTPVGVDGAGIYVDGTYGDDSNTGAVDKPVRTIENALSKLGTLDTIYIRGKVTISDAKTISLPQGVTIKRSASYGNYLFEIVDGGTLTIENAVIDGNTNVGTNTTGQINNSTASLVNIESKNGTAILNVNSGTVLKNNYGNSGGAIRNRGGELNFNSGTIENCQAIHDKGNAISIMKSDLSDGQFNINATGTVSIQGNVYLAEDLTVDLSGSHTNVAGTIKLKSANTDSGTVLATTESGNWLTKIVHDNSILSLEYDLEEKAIKIQ